MSLATRCTECGTVFRVVQDQLKVSEGWVRCGRCSAVFNALENLCELDAEAPPDSGRAPFAAGRQEPMQAAVLPDEPAEIEQAQSEPAFAEEASGFDAARSAYTPPALPDDDLPGAIVSFSSESLPDDEPPLRPAQVAPAPEPAQQARSFESDAPRFVQAADRAAVWRRPRVRAGLALASVLMSVLLAAQVALAGRDWLAAHLPASRPLLSAACNLAGCHIEPLKRIALLSVDSSGLSRLESAAVYRLSVVLRNRADIAVAAPALDLSLTDGAGQLVARRVLRPTDLGLPPVIEAGQELPLQALLSTGEHRVSGYTVELFYP
jgi:predicted Zn finger-like uncharacterized protein